MAAYPPVAPANGANFTQVIHNDTYPFINSRTNSNHVGRAVFITGGNRGIGKAIAISFAQAGASFIGLGCPDGFGNPPISLEIEDAAKQCGRPPPTVLLLHLDITDDASVAAAAAQVQKSSLRLDVLVNNAGFMTPALPIVDAEIDSWWKTLEVNLRGTFLMCKHFTPLLNSTQGGLQTLVNINSVAAHNLRPQASAYGTSKFAVLKFTEFLLLEQKTQGLLAFSVHPGGVMTQLAEAMPKDTHATFTDNPSLAGDTVAFLTGERREWLAGRYLSCTWDMEELLARQKEIEEGDKLKVRLVL